MKKIFVILAMVAAFTLAAEVVTIPLMANSQTVAENSNIDQVNSDNALLAAVLSVLVPGLGQIYVGKVTRGLMIFGGFIVLYVLDIVLSSILTGISYTIGSIAGCVFSILILGAWIWQIYDAYKLGGGSVSGLDNEDNNDDSDDDVFIPAIRPVSLFNN